MEVSIDTLIDHTNYFCRYRTVT